MCLRVLLVDDEDAARDRLRFMLEELDVEVVGEARNGVEALALAAERRPDVLLLDIAMPEVDGLDVARHLPAPRALVIFQTAHDEYALRAFEHEALDYVVKPVTLPRLRAALERAERRVAAGVSAPPTPALQRIQAALGPAAARVQRRVLVRHGVGYRLIALRDVLRFQAERGHAIAHLPDQTYETDYSIGELAERTAGAFVRASRADLVNIERIERFERDPDGSARLRLTDGSIVRVSRRRASEVWAALEG